MKKRNLSILLVGAIALFNTGFCQSQFSATLHFPRQLTLKDITVIFNDGKRKNVSVPVKDYTITIKENLYARFASITVYYPDSSKRHTFFSGSFWVGGMPAEIYIVSNTAGVDPFGNCKLENAYLEKDMGRGKLDSFERDEWKAFDQFIRIQNGPPSDSASRELDALGKKLRNKELQFIQQNTDLYYSFWFFRSELTTTRSIDVDSLLSFFNSVFPDSLRQSMEGKEALQALEARINTEKGMMAPDYSAKDVADKIVSSKTDSGKYVLLDFWASWCIPCIREMPLIKDLNTKYSGNKFNVISISLDSDRKSFEDALSKNKMNWTQIFGNGDLIRAYNVSGIPAIFLIDPSGRIIYKSGEMKKPGTNTDDSDLKELFSMLHEKLD